ncbi:MAG: Flagellar hook-length control protein FliK, partial [Frankiales bacterium]|nr:Flagellar hook-length control protein FliK [Frankiales bacterium]
AVPVQAAAAAATSAPGTPVQAAAAADERTVAQVRPALTELARGLKSEGGQASLLIRLDPPDLGPVLVRLTVTDNRVDVQLRAPEIAATAGLAGASADVQRVLAEHGLDLSSFDVRQGELAGGGTGSSRQQEQDARQAPGRGTSGQQSAADAGTGTNGSRVTDDATAAGDPASDTWL